MKHFRAFVICMLSLGLTSLAMESAAYEVQVATDDGEMHILDFQPEESFKTVFEVLQQITNKNAQDNTLRMEFFNNDGELLIKAQSCPKAAARDYTAAVTADQKKDIGYILKTLGNASLTKIAKQKSSLEKAGNRIESIHPFKFLETIFTDEELIVSIRNLQGRSKLWPQFRDPLISSLSAESDVGNLTPYTQDLASTLKIDVSGISADIDNKNWSGLISDLITLVPRTGDSNRYSGQ